MKLSPEAEAEIDRLELDLMIGGLVNVDALRAAMLWAYQDAARLCREQVAVHRANRSGLTDGMDYAKAMEIQAGIDAGLIEARVSQKDFDPRWAGAGGK